MSLEATTYAASRFFRGISLMASLLLLAFPVALHGQKQEEFEEYKIRFEFGWFFPTRPAPKNDGMPLSFPIRSLPQLMRWASRSQYRKY